MLTNTAQDVQNIEVLDTACMYGRTLKTLGQRTWLTCMVSTGFIIVGSSPCAPLYAFYTRCRDALVVILKHNACKKGTPTSPVILAQLLPCVSPPMSNVILAHSSLLCFLDRLLSYMKNLCPNFFATNNGIPSRYLVFSHADPQMLINIFRITSFMHFFY